MFDLRPPKWECCGLGASTQKAINPVEDEKPYTPRVKTSRTGKIDQAEDTFSRAFHKDLNLHPSKLTRLLFFELMFGYNLFYWVVVL